uniref:DUF223 domain-containing protein n=1 Tax=Oryza nivara TaxID=4536 RepID=A0A0E0GX71_ORYNI
MRSKSADPLISIDGILLDEHGSMAQISVPKKLEKQFRPLLNEGSVYLITNTTAVDARRKTYIYQHQSYMIHRIGPYDFASPTSDKKLRRIQIQNQEYKLPVTITDKSGSLDAVAFSFVAEDLVELDAAQASQNMKIDSVEHPFPISYVLKRSFSIDDTMPNPLLTSEKLSKNKDQLQFPPPMTYTSSPRFTVLSIFSIHHIHIKLYLLTANGKFISAQLLIIQDYPKIVHLQNHLQLSTYPQKRTCQNYIF